MTIQGAMKELVNLLNADDIPVYYKGGIEKVIETIDDYIDGKDDYVKRMVDRKTEPQKTTDYCDTCNHKGCDNCIADGSNPYCVPSHYEPKTEPTISKMEQVDEPQTDCYVSDLCKHYGDKQICGRCRNRNLFAEADTEPKPKTEPQTEDTCKGCVNETDCPWK